MEVDEFIRECPFVFHMAEAGSWDSIRKRGLLSTSALLDLFEITGQLRAKIESSRRSESVIVSHVNYGDAVIRDQNLLREDALAACLQDGLRPQDWYELLNSHVFFWARRHRLEGLLKARLYKNKEHDVLTVDTVRLVEKHEARLRLCPYNSGNTMQVAVPRGKGTFKQIADYPFEYWRKKRSRAEAIVEVAAIGGVPDIRDCVVRVERRRGADVLQVLHEAT
jgi:hypothetical protein